jgi:hypothetical protein
MTHLEITNPNLYQLMVVRRLILLFIVCLVISGLTAFPLQTELEMLTNSKLVPGLIQPWLRKVYAGLDEVNTRYPFISYGTDWLAFAHIAIAVFFIGTYFDPVRNSWIIKAGMICCLLIFPVALIAGNVRGIPFFWRIIDCSFGFFGFVLLWVIYRKIGKLEMNEVKLKM